MGCMETAAEPRVDVRADEDVEMQDCTDQAPPEPSRKLLFRCLTCKRLAHYAHLPLPRGMANDSSAVALAEYYQDTNEWLCLDCSSYQYKLEKILAWRPYPSTAQEKRAPGEKAHYKQPLPREYLVKWAGRSYRRTQWVPHMWLLSTNPSRLKYFIEGGAKVELLKEPIDTTQGADRNAMDVDTLPTTTQSLLEGKAQKPMPKPEEVTIDTALAPLTDAEKRIPLAWKTIDRVLSILLRLPKKTQAKKKKSRTAIISSDDEDEEAEEDEETRRAFDDGEPPSDEYTISIDEWEKKKGRLLEMGDIDQIVWAFFKWDDLGYDEGLSHSLF